MSNEISFFCDNTDVVARIFGVGDIHANNIERQLGVVLVNRDLEIKISGDDAESVQRCKGLIQHLAKTAEMCEDLSEQTVNYAINMCV